jgi:tetratricopeptide (TPR) repeat protein
MTPSSTTIESKPAAARAAANRLRSVCLGLVVAAFAVIGLAGEATAVEAAKPGERFEVTAVKAVRPTIVDTIAALQQRDVARAKATFQAYDSAWNGIEMYINTRSKDMYDALEHVLQAKIEKGLDAPSPDATALLADAQAMLVKYDEAIDMVAKAPPLNPLWDDIARLRIVRAHLREVPPALKAGNFEKARKSYAEFDNTWDSIEDLIKAKSADDYVAIEKGMIDIEKALMPEKPDVAQATGLVNAVMAKYNANLAEIVKEARSRP